MAAKKVLLVEGKDDKHVMMALFGQRSLPRLSEIKDHEGYNSLLEAIPIRVKESDVEAVGILIDADIDSGARWSSVRLKLASAGYSNLPVSIPASGMILHDPEEIRPRIGVWIMPDNSLSGILEDFIRRLVPGGDQLIALAERAIDSIPIDQRRFAPQHRPKAIIHTWLAWQSDPGIPMGQAITARFLDHECSEASVLVRWLWQLYYPNSLPCTQT